MENIIVTESSSNIRALGRDALKGKWGLSALAMLIYYFVMVAPMMIFMGILGPESNFGMLIIMLYIFLVMGPLMLGGSMFILSVFRKQDSSVAEIFYGFERFGKATGLYLVIVFFTVLWSFLLIIPGYIAAIRYSMSFFVLADNPEMGVMEALNESKRLMKGNKWKFFCLYLSFIGWSILGAITYIGDLFVMPYIYVSIAAFYDIANGSLRAVKSNMIQGESLINSAASGVGEDPVTVYKEIPGAPEAYTAGENHASGPEINGTEADQAPAPEVGNSDKAEE